MMRRIRRIVRNNLKREIVGKRMIRRMIRRKIMK